MIKKLRAGSLGACLLAASGCTLQMAAPVYQTEPVVVERSGSAAPQTSTAPAKTAPEPSSHTGRNNLALLPDVEAVTPRSVPVAVKQLLDDARHRLGSGNTQGAIRSLERAQRLVSDYPDTYYLLAKARKQENNFRQCEQVALRGVGFTDRGEVIRSRLWTMIAACRRATGDIKGAEQALQAR